MRCSRCALRPPQFAEIETKCLRPLSKIDRLGRYALPPDRQAGRSCTAMMPDGIIIDMHQSKIFPSLPRFTKWTFFFLPPKTFDLMFLFLGRVGLPRLLHILLPAPAWECFLEARIIAAEGLRRVWRL